ncbi:flagellar assembly protein FliH [Halorhodospira halochloris]|uniref:flagellar assembly protein FliH n=1 Tax=Halorhodospira halochloris TaxID=1052 RepID=UPI001EE95BE3|nr:flagellar assembly protein FliH [Halorhodospira halochloris]MCG5529996.1 flagellar assembly protein FliH [Halorhodospira halochloris]
MDNTNKRFRVIPGEALDGIETWETPDFDEPERERLRQLELEEQERARQEELEKRRRQRERKRRAVYQRLKQEDEARRALPSEEEIEKIRAEAHREGYKTGHREGKLEGFHAGYPEGVKAGEEDGRKSGARLVRRLRTLLDTLGRPLEKLDREIEDELSHLVFGIAKRMVLSELRRDPSHAESAVNRALKELPANQRWISVHVNPEEIGFIEEQLGADAEQRGWTMVADQQVSRGGCVVRTETSRVDASVERRIEAVAEQLFGDAHATQETEEVVRTYRGEAEQQQEEAAPAQTDNSAEASTADQSSATSSADAPANQSSGGSEQSHAAGQAEQKTKRDRSSRRRRGTRRKREDGET